MVRCSEGKIGRAFSWGQWEEMPQAEAKIYNFPHSQDPRKRRDCRGPGRKEGCTWAEKAREVAQTDHWAGYSSREKYRKRFLKPLETDHGQLTKVHGRCSHPSPQKHPSELVCVKCQSLPAGLHVAANFFPAFLLVLLHLWTCHQVRSRHRPTFNSCEADAAGGSWTPWVPQLERLTGRRGG